MDELNKPDNEKAYDAISDMWHNFRSTTAINQCIVDFAKLLAPCGNILDIGCGTGYPIAEYFSSHKFCVTGIDISSKMIEYANGLHLKSAKFLRRDILDFSTDTRFDGVVAFDSLWHIDKEKQAEAYRKIASLMKSRAYLIFTHGNRSDETVGTMFEQKFYYGALNTAEILSVFKEVGLKALSCIENYKEKTTGERDLLVVAQKI